MSLSGLSLVVAWFFKVSHKPLKCYASLKGMNKVKSGDRIDSIKSLLYLVKAHMPKECKVTENNGACQSLFYFKTNAICHWFIRFKVTELWDVEACF